MLFQSKIEVFYLLYIPLIKPNLLSLNLLALVTLFFLSPVKSYASQITLTWDASHNSTETVDGYNLYYWQPGWDFPVGVDVGTQTTYTLTELEEDQLYHFAVTAYSHSGNESLFSNEVETMISRSNNLALGEVSLPVFNVTASADDGNVAANTIDGDLNTRWSAAGDGQWIRFDLDAIQSITAVGIAFYPGDQRSSLFDIEVSNDSSTWTNTFSGRSSGISSQFETFDLAGAIGRYVRIVGHGRIGSGWNSIAEVTIFGE